MTERRRNLELRARVDVACRLIAPFFESANQWAGHSQDLLAYRTLRERMPELDAVEAHVVVQVVRRIVDESTLVA
jgi:hypothetical protein